MLEYCPQKKHGMIFAMPAIHIRQRFHAPIQETFDAVTRHKMLADVTPGLWVDVIKHSDDGKEGLGSVRAMGLPFFKPLQEEVTAYESPYRLEYKVVGSVKKLIQEHQGILEFTESGEFTLVDWHVYLRAYPRVMNKLVLASLEKSLTKALAKEAKRISRT